MFDSRNLLCQEIKTLSSVVGHDFTSVVLSDSDVDTFATAASSDDSVVSTDLGFTATPLSDFLECADLADQRFLLHPACRDLYACLEHYATHKVSSTSAVIVLPKQPGMWRKYLRNAQMLKEFTCSDALFAPCDDDILGKHVAQVYYDSPAKTDSICTVVGSLGLTMQFQGSISGVPTFVLMDSCCINTCLLRMLGGWASLWTRWACLLCKWQWPMAWYALPKGLARYASNCSSFLLI